MSGPLLTFNRVWYDAISLFLSRSIYSMCTAVGVGSVRSLIGKVLLANADALCAAAAPLMDNEEINL